MGENSEKHLLSKTFFIYDKEKHQIPAFEELDAALVLECA